MTTVFVIAAVLLGADGQQTGLKQPSIVKQAHPGIVVMATKPAESAIRQQRSTSGGLIKPVNYQDQPTLTKMASVPRGENFSLLQDLSPSDNVSPSDSLAPAVAPPIPSVPKPMPPQPMPETSNSPAPILSDNYIAAEDYSMDSTGCGCDTCGCQHAHGCNLGCQSGCCNGGCGVGGHGGFYARHCLPSPWHAPGNMVPHIPYVAFPKTYYYFRPYNMLMIPRQQAIASAWVKNPQLPYSNGVFKQVFAELEPVLNAEAETIEPASN
ncbi:hypothetical protein GC197_01385 [bacterium]|nr:hypothetical protein [bacterium]